MIPKNLDTLSEFEVAQLLHCLEHQERAVIRLRFGLPGNQPMTMNDIGKALNITREEVRQIEINAMVKLGWIRLVA